MQRLLTLVEVAERLGTSPRFARRLVDERRIGFVRVGRHIRVSEYALDAFVAAGVVDPISLRWRDGRVVA